MLVKDTSLQQTNVSPRQGALFGKNECDETIAFKRKSECDEIALKNERDEIASKKKTM